MQYFPSQSNPSSARENRSVLGPVTDTRQVRRSGADTPDDRTALDNSRVVPPPSFSMRIQGDSRLWVSNDIQGLLDLDDNLVELNVSTDEADSDGADGADESDAPQLTTRAAFAAPAVERHVDAAVPPVNTTNRPINHNLPPSSYRFQNMSLTELLQEVAARAVGDGPPDPAMHLLATTLPDVRRLDDMVWALRYQPGRERDAKVLRDAGLTLSDFFPYYRKLVVAVRERRPDLQPMMAEWTADLLREPIRKALEMHQNPGEEPTAGYSGSGPLRENIERPYDAHVAELDARMNERRRFSELPLLSLLEEAVQRAIGHGSPDARPPTDTTTAPEATRIDGMVRVLQGVNGRHNDAVTLGNAGRLLHDLFTGLRNLLRDIRSRRPDLEPVLQAWITDLARPALQRALDVPGIADRSFVPDPRLSWDIARVTRDPVDGFVPVLDRRLMQHLEPAFIARFPEFFLQMSRTGKPGETLQNTIRGAAPGESTGQDARLLLQGNVVFRCTEAQLAANMQMIPSATITAVPERSPFRAQGAWRLARWAATYPRGAGENSLQAVSWEPPGGKAMPVFVAMHQGVHSYSYGTRKGLPWKPTGGPGHPAMDLIRTERWEEFLTHLRTGAYRGFPRRDADPAPPKD